MTRIFHRLFLWKWIPCQAVSVTSVLCLLFRSKIVQCSTKNAYTSEITFLALLPWVHLHKSRFVHAAVHLLINGFVHCFSTPSYKQICPRCSTPSYINKQVVHAAVHLNINRFVHALVHLHIYRFVHAFSKPSYKQVCTRCSTSLY